MKIRFGYACVTVTLDTTSSSVMTYSYYQKLEENKALEKLDIIIKSNFDSLKKILEYNVSNNIYVFRMTANLMPLVTHPDVSLDWQNRYKKELEDIGNFVNKNKIRLSLHLEHFCVLNSVYKDVVANTINILKFYIYMFEIMKIKPQIILHVGGKTNGKEEGIQRFIDVVSKLPKTIKDSLVLENDDKIYNIKDVLYICETLNIKMCFDYHHYMCNNDKEKIEDYIERIFLTWKEDTPKIHFSSPKSKKNIQAHSDYIDFKSFVKFVNKIKFINQDFDIMIESKMKDEAVFRLIRRLKQERVGKIRKNSLIL